MVTMFPAFLQAVYLGSCHCRWANCHYYWAVVSLAVFNGLCGLFIGLRETPLVCVVLLRLHVDVGLLAVRG